MSTSKLQEVMNRAGAESGASVEFKRRSADGSVVMDADPADVERVDLEMKMAQLSRMVATLPRAEKLAFSAEVRKQGNEKFASGDFDGAADLYMQSLAGLDLGAAQQDTSDADVSLGGGSGGGGGDGGTEERLVAESLQTRTAELAATESRDAIQVPVLCNLAACALQTRKWSRTIALTTMALDLDPGAWKAHR